MLKAINILFLFFYLTGLQAQTNGDTASAKIKISSQDSTASKSVTKVKHSPKKATILSMVLPGAGQVYNKKNWWWKVPLIYGAGGVLIYSAIFYQNGYTEYRAAYKERIESPTGLNSDPQYNRYQPLTLQSIRDSYRESRDMCYIGLVGVYALQIMDAAVEAHFFDFNINENVSLNIQPHFNIVNSNTINGVQLTLKF